MNEKEFCTKAEAQKELGMTVHTFDRYALLFNLNGEKRGREKLYRREDVERVKELLDSSTLAAIALIQKKAGKRIREIVFEED